MRILLRPLALATFHHVWTLSGASASPAPTDACKSSFLQSDFITDLLLDHLPIVCISFMETFESLKSVISLLISLLALVGIVWLYLSYGKNYKPETRNARLLYISGYGAFIILELIVYIVMGIDQKNDIISVISFGATLSSLIMSVVAIIFTIVSGKRGEEQLWKVSSATDELKNTAQSILEFKSIVHTLSLKITNLESEVGQLHEDTKNLSDSVLQNLEMINTIQVKPVQFTNNVDNKEAPIQKFVETTSYMGAELLLACIYSKEKNKVFDTSKMGEDFNGNVQQYMFGYTIALTSAGYVNFNGQWPSIVVTAISEDFKGPLINKILQYQSILTDESVQESYRVKINTICDYFGEERIFS